MYLIPTFFFRLRASVVCFVLFLFFFQLAIYAKYDQDTRIIEVKQGKFIEFISPAKGNIRDTYISQNLKVR